MRGKQMYLLVGINTTTTLNWSARFQPTTILTIWRICLNKLSGSSKFLISISHYFSRHFFGGLDFHNALFLSHHQSVQGQWLSHFYYGCPLWRLGSGTYFPIENGWMSIAMLVYYKVCWYVLWFFWVATKLISQVALVALVAYICLTKTTMHWDMPTERQVLWRSFQHHPNFHTWNISIMNWQKRAFLTDFPWEIEANNKAWWSKPIDVVSLQF